MLLQFYDGSRWSEERFSRHTFAFSCRSYALTLHCVNGTWHLRLPQELQLVSSEDCIYRHIFIVKDTVCSYPIYLFEQEEPCVFHKYSLVSKNRITFGGSPEADIQIFDERVKGIVFSMDISNRQFCIQEDTIPLVKEGVRVTTSSIQLDGMYAFLNCHFLLQGEFLMLEEVPNVLTTLDFYVSPQCMHSFENRQPVSIEYLVIIKADSAFQKEVHLPHVTEEPIRRPLIFLLGPTVCMSLGSLVTGISEQILWKQIYRKEYRFLLLYNPFVSYRHLIFLKIS